MDSDARSWAGPHANTFNFTISSKRTILPHKTDALSSWQIVGNLVELILGPTVVSAGQPVEDNGRRTSHTRRAGVCRGRNGRK